MNSKYFAVKISKGVEGGRIRLKGFARFFDEGYDSSKHKLSEGTTGIDYGQTAYIFQRGDKAGHPSWTVSQSLGDEHESCALIMYFLTGAAAAKYLEELRLRLFQLDAKYEALLQEVAALEV